jgi:hypothetical protein
VSRNKGREHRQLWRIVDGAVLDCLTCHPDYFNSEWPAKVIRASIVKRVVGAIHGYSAKAGGAVPGDARPAAARETSERQCSSPSV